MKLLNTIIPLVFLTLQLSAQNKKVAELIFEGSNLHSQGKYTEAIDKYKSALAMDKNSALAYYDLAFTSMTIQKYDDAIKFSRKVIEMNSCCREAAFSVLGNSLDRKEKPKEALRAYGQGLRNFQKSRLLNYDLARAAYKTGDYSVAEKAAIRAIRANPEYAGSHLVLANVMKAKGERVKAMLPLYYFLLLEPNSEQSQVNYNMLKSMMDLGVDKKAGNDVSISITAPNAKDTVWTPGELMISLLNATRYLDTKHPKTDLQFFAEINRSLFGILGDKKANNTDLWWDLYVTKFYDLVTTDNWEAFSYYISQSENSDEVNKWIADNPGKMKSFNEWKDH